MQKQIREQAVLKIGGVAVGAFSAYEDALEVILVIRVQSNFYAVVTTGNRAHRAYRIKKGQAVQVTGPVVEYPYRDTFGYKYVFAVACERLSIGKVVCPGGDPFPDHQEISKLRIFEKCNEFESEENPAIIPADKQSTEI